MSMTVRELIIALEGMDMEAKVRLATQPNWPFEYSIDQVVEMPVPVIITRAEYDAMSEDEQGYAEEKAEEGEAVLLDEGQEAPQATVYIGEGTQLGYLPAAASRALGWR